MNKTEGVGDKNEGDVIEGTQESTSVNSNQEGVKSFEDTGKARVEAGIQYMKSAGQKIGGIFEKAKGKIGGFFKKAGQFGMKAVYNIAAAPEIMDAGLQKVDEVGNMVGGKIDQGLDYAGGKITEGAETVYNKGVEIKNTVVNEAEAAWIDLKLMVTEAEAIVAEKARTIAEWKDRKAEQITQTVEITLIIGQMVAEAVKEGAEEKIVAAGAKLSEGYNKVRQFGAESMAFAKQEALKAKVSFFGKINNLKMKLFERMAERNENKAKRWNERKAGLQAKIEFQSKLINQPAQAAA